MKQNNLFLKYLNNNAVLEKEDDYSENTGNIVSENFIINKIEKINIEGESVYKLASGFYYVYEDENIITFADELYKYDDLNAAAVLGYDQSVKGIVLRSEFFDIIGKPFGRDIYKNKKIKLLSKECRTFFFDESILNVSRILGNELKDINNHNYLITDKNNKFYGIFSTKNILLYLSEITQKDLLLAERLQKRIVKDEYLLNDKSIDIAAVSKMANEVGGDFYSIKNINDEKLLISIFDISGKGISASLLTSLLGGMLNTYDFNRGLKQFVLILNRYIFKTFELEKYATGILLILNKRNNEISIYDAGHSYIYIYRSGKFHKIKTNDNLPIGVSDNITPVFTRVKLHQNDILFLFTDGITDQRNSLGKLYSLRNIEKIFLESGKKSADEIKELILKDIADFKKENYQQDDITFIILKK